MHITRNIPCEDFSSSVSAGRYHIAVVADGHGASVCFRSKRGSKFAVESAVDCLGYFAGVTLQSRDSEERFYKDMFSNPRFRKNQVRHLTDTIIAEWYNRVMVDYRDNPLSKEEQLLVSGDRIEHIYGTTLIAALWLPKCLILLQQGDGRCDVFYGDGSVDQPIPWDKRCQDFTTTSLCDEDVAVSFRSSVINLEKKPVIACYLGCDGVEDAYRDTYEDCGGRHTVMAGVHTFYKELTRQIAVEGKKVFEANIENFLSYFSENGIFSRGGSGDDVSVAGIVDTAAVVDYVKQYERDINYYAYEERLFTKRDELRGKTRKHDILRKRMEDAESEYRMALKAAEGNRHGNSAKERRLIAEKETEFEKAEKLFSEYDEKYCRIENEIGEILNEMKALSR
jgi:hypothetical protein